MARHDYTPQQALELLLKEVRTRRPDLAEAIQAAIDAGKDVIASEALERGRRRDYRKKVPFSHQEALEIAKDVLQAYYLELPLLANVASEELAKAGLSDDNDVSPAWSNVPVGKKEVRAVGQPKRLAIEVQVETSITGDKPATLDLSPTSDWDIEAQKRRLNRVSDLLKDD